MATVYLGTDTRLDRTVALKIMHAELANDEDFVRRFVGEARSVARLSHPNVVGVYDQGADGRTLYLAMEYVPGRTLRDLLNERGRLEAREALDIMDGVLGGLGAAHAAGLAHRDVKPENVLLTSGHSVKVADFGLARMLAGSSQTKTGMLIGTAAYLAPEQVSRGRADARTDVYAAGIMLFELLTGTQPHTADTPLAVAYKHVNEVVPAPSRIVPGLAPALDALVAMATSRDPDLRPADAGQFLRAVTEVRQGLPQPGPAYPAAPGAGFSGVPGGYPDPQRSPVPPPILDYQPAIWQAEAAPSQPAGDLIPGLAEPAVPAHTQVQDDAFYRSANHTLVVAPGAATDYGHGRGGYGGSPEPGLQRWLFSRKLGYVIAGLAAMVLVSLFVWWQSAGRYTTVPQVGGLAATTASLEVRNEGLVAKLSSPQFSNRVAKGDIIGTQPAIGSQVNKGATVMLIVSAGPRMISVPQVTGGTLPTAQAALRQAGLVPGTVTNQASTTIQSGIVISTTPAAGVSWPQNRPVTLVVSTGQPVPNFVGQQKAVAEQWAQANNVSLNEVADAKSTQPAGTVTQQSVAAGSSFTPHQVITIAIANGPQMVSVPNVEGQPVTQAEQTLSQAGFQVKVVMIGPLDKVFNESPSGQAPQGSVITLYAGL